jgi:hypothetical protein
MPKTVSTLDLAQRLRRDAQETTEPQFAHLMLRAAEELEEYVHHQATTVASDPRRRQTG